MHNTAQSYYRTKSKGYYSSSRSDIAALIPLGRNKILDVGSGNCSLLLSLKQEGKASEIVGIEINALEFPKGIDNIIVGDIEQLQLPYPAGYFDVIICADVLEHLHDPWSTLKKLVYHVKPQGMFIASLPNIRELRTLWGICGKGTFHYEERGILDKTHLRFFCRKDMCELIRDAGLEITKVMPLMGRRRALVSRLTLGLAEEFLAIQYVLVARK